MTTAASLFATRRAARLLELDAPALIDPAAAVYAAEGAGRATGLPAAAITHGPAEALAAVPACHTGWGDRRPLVVVNVATPAAGAALRRVYKPVTDASLTADDDPAGAVDEAVRLAAERGPVQVIVSPARAAAATAAAARLTGRAPAGDSAGSWAAAGGGAAARAPSEADVSRVAEALARAERPVVLCGAGATRGRATRSALALAERLQAPLLLTMAASCPSIPEASALAEATAAHPGVPVLTHLGAGPALKKAGAEADLVLALGTAFSEVDGFGLTSYRPWSRSARIVSVSLGDEPAPPHLAPPLRVHAGALELAEALLPRLEPAAPREWAGAVAKEARAWAARVGNEARAEVPLPGGLVAREALRRAPAGSVFVSEGSSAGVWLGAYAAEGMPRPVAFPAQEATIGVTIPMAIGAALASPGGRAVGMIGDGAALYHAQELATAARLGVGLVLVVFNNRAWNLLRQFQTYTFEGRHVATDLPSVDFAAIARGYGCLGLSAATPEELGAALDEAFAAGSPAVVDVAIDPDATPYMGLHYALCEFDGVMGSLGPGVLASGAAMARRRRLEPRLADRVRFIAAYARRARAS